MQTLVKCLLAVHGWTAKSGNACRICEQGQKDTFGLAFEKNHTDVFFRI